MTASTPYTVPTPPVGTEIIVRSRCVGDDPQDCEHRRVPAGDTGQYHPAAPLQSFSAFDADGRWLGAWSPGYPSLGWDAGGPGSTPAAAVCDLLRIRRLAREEIAYARLWNRIVAGETIHPDQCRPAV